MASTPAYSDSTLLDCVVQSLGDAARHQPGAEEKPAAILWTDAKGEWRILIPKLRERLPELLIYGEYDPAARTGPAIWLRCVIAGKLPEFAPPRDKASIIYLPEVSRQSLRAGDDCPWELQPLVELQYRGAVWTQKSGRDWTVDAMLVSDDGLGLDMAKDAATRRSLMAALAVLAETPQARLAGRKLEAEDFDKLMVGDTARDLLAWMSSPVVARSEMTSALVEGGKWHAFRSRCQQDFGFDPERDGELVAGERLGQRESSVWTNLWTRFCESPAAYPGVPALLRRSKPPANVLFDKHAFPESWPDVNEGEEQTLRAALGALDGEEGTAARARIAELEGKHGERRGWVWAKLSQAPLAMALAHLAELAERTKSHLGGESPDEMAGLYASGAFLADDAALRALSAVKTTADTRAIQAAVRAVYLPWIEAAAERFQKLTAGTPLPTAGVQATVAADVGSCLLFADGLRFDLAQRLIAAVEERGLRASQSRRWSALPSVTATAKPAVSPVAPKIRGQGLTDTFAPEVKATEQTLTTDRFRKLLTEGGYQVIASGELGDPAATKARGWCEFGEIDRRGHALEIGLANEVAGEVEHLADKIADLIDAGWRSVRVVTDHGWLLMPGGLPRHDLPHYLVESKWSRCAGIKGESKPGASTATWHWNNAAEFAVAPGVACFSAGHDYAHGGLSLQECLLADILVEPVRDASGPAPKIVSAEWFGMRLRVTVAPADATLLVDIRQKANTVETTLAVSTKHLDGDGKAGLFVEDEDLAGTTAIVVVVDTDGRVLAKLPTTVGGED